MNCDIKFNNVLLWGQAQTLDTEILFMLDYATIANNLFKWKGVPEEIPINVMEFNLFGGGRLAFFKDNDLGYMALPTGAFGKINNYGLPTAYTAIGAAGYSKLLDMDEAVIIKNDPLYMPCYPYVQKLCKRMADIWNAIGVNLNACKTPFIAYGDKTEVLTFKNTYKKIVENEPLICYNNTDKITAPMQTLDIKAQYFGDKWSSLLIDTENKILTYLGINNVNIEKRERVNTQEVSANNEIVNYHLLERLKARQDACEEINKKFGLNMSVELNKEYIETQLMQDLQNTQAKVAVSEGGVENE